MWILGLKGLQNKEKIMITSLMFPDTPNLIFPDSSVQKETQARWLIEICEEHVKKFVFNAHELSILVEQTAELQDANKQEGRWKCRAEGCMATYAYHSSRVRCLSILMKCYISKD